MLMLNATGKSAVEAVDMLRDAIDGSDESELKILIDNPSQATELKKFLEIKGFTDIVPEDDDGSLYLVATRKTEAPSQPPKPQPAKTEYVNTVPQSLCVLMSNCGNKHRADFLGRVISSLHDATNKPVVLALMDGAVKLAAYDSRTCDTLKKLESEGVRVIVSSSCADRLGMTEALGAGVAVSMSEVLDEISSCGKIISL